jgi:hypothetical protein
MQIIDFKRKGNVVRFYLGDATVHYWGDDWNDRPYEHNAGQVYEEFIKGYKDVAFDFDDLVLEPCCGTYNSRWSKEDMVARRVPCIIAVPKEVHQDSWDDAFDAWAGADGIKKYYFGDDELVLNK